jgi:leucyl-tRNA synthetase
MILGESAFAKRLGVNLTFYGEQLLMGKMAEVGFGALNYLTESEKLILNKLQEKYSFNENYFFSEELISQLNSEEEQGQIIQEKIANLLLKDLTNEIDAIGLKDRINYGFTPLLNNFRIYKTHVPVEFVSLKNELDEDSFKNWRKEFLDAEFITEKEGKFIVGREVEKMSKSKYNVVNPDAICEQYGADSLRLYEMFLGPLEQAKPWNTAGITGVHGFLKKLWKLYHQGDDINFQNDSNHYNHDVYTESEYAAFKAVKRGFGVTDTKPTADNLKTLHKTIKKVEEDIENFSFNTTVSTFMIACNELTAQKCTSKDILEPLLVLMSPYAPHIAEELWNKLGHKESISTAPFPKFDESFLVESSKEYPISFNGKTKFTMELSLDLNKDDIEKAVMSHEKTKAQLQGRQPKKVIIVPGKIVNIVG